MLILDFSDFVNLITDTELGVHYILELQIN